VPGAVRPTVLGWPPNLVFGLMAAASFFCCVPMAMPQTHLVALCSDLGIKPTHGAVMLSMLLAVAFLSRQMWGWISDRIGGLVTVLAGSAWQFFSVFGLGFSGIIPAYVLAVRELFPAHQAGWRVPMLLCLTAFGMASGGWVAGMLYDHFGYYAPAFAAGLIFNFVNLVLIGTLVARRSGRLRPRLAYG